MLYVFHGPDDYTRDQAVHQLQGRLGDPEMASLNTTRLDAPGLSVGALAAAVGSMPFLAEHRLVIVSGLLSRFNPRRGAADSARGGGSKAEAWQGWVDPLGQVPDFTWLVLVDGEVDYRNPLLRALPPGAQVKSFERLRGDALLDWIARRVREQGGGIVPEATQMLAAATDDLRVLAGEIDKLLLYAEGGRIAGPHVKEMVGYAREFDVFALVDAVLQRRATPAARLLQQLLGQGEAPPYLLFMLARQFRQVILARDLLDRRAPEGEMRRALGQPSDFVLRKLVQQARGYSLSRLEDAYFRLLAADLDSKTGRLEPALALELLLVDLARPG